MEIVNLVLKLIGMFFLLIGVLCVYDARRISEKFFGTSDRNIATRKLKILGFAVFIIAGLFVTFIKV